MQKLSKTYLSIVVRFTELSDFACKHKKNTVSQCIHIVYTYKINLEEYVILIIARQAVTRLKVPYSALSRWVSRPDRVV